MKVCSDFGILVFFLVYEIILVVCVFCTTIRACGCLLFFVHEVWLFVLSL
jgi:hypothetical protein